MKKVMFTLGLFLVGLASQAQEFSKNAIGLRLGDNDGLGYEISYQRGMSDINRLELDLGWRNSDNADAFKLTGIYQWVWDLSALAPGFNWYAGAGAGVGHWSFDGPNNNDDGDFFVTAGGDIGIEYNLNIPLQISLDARPEIGVINGGGDLDFDIALGVRYKF